MSPTHSVARRSATKARCDSFRWQRFRLVETTYVSRLASSASASHDRWRLAQSEEPLKRDVGIAELDQPLLLGEVVVPPYGMIVRIV